MNERLLQHKKRFNTKQNREDGLILQLHHVVDNDDIKNVHHIKFIHADFDYNSNQLSACDLQQNIFIVNFHFNQYWLIPNEKSHMAMFVPSKRDLILSALKTGDLHFIQTENGERVGILEGHTKPVKYISFSNDCCCLTASEQQAIIWNLRSNTQIHHLQLENRTTAFKHICFVPVSFNIFACYNDDVIHVWKNNTFKTIQDIHPSTWKGRNVNSIAFTRNGRALVIGGRMPYLVVFSIDTWTIDRIIHLPTEINGVRQILFIPQLFDGGSNRILGVLSLKNTLHFFDMEDNKFLNQTQSNETYTCINKFYCSPDAKYLACILNTGELNVYLSKLTKIIDLPLCKKKEKYSSKSKNITKLKAVKIKKIDKGLEINRLIDVLKQFGEYPADYRTLIWKIILKIPENQTEFTSLVSRGYHPAFRNLEAKYPLESHLSIMNLKRILSVLANWCPLFSQVENFPLFVFPFVRVFHNDPLINFEVVLTIIMNWCQYWFEYFPFPPLNLTSMIENILADQDPLLLKHLNDYGVSSVLYGWSLLETAFSEIMTRSEWLQFWDHVISNDTSFLTIATAAYNIYKRSTIMSFKCYEQFEYFYHNQNTINMNTFIKQCYQLFHKIDHDIHPAKYFQEFQPLQKDSYPSFTCYPKQMIDYQTENINKMREQEMQLENEEFEIIEKKAAQLAKLKQQIRENENDIRMKNLQQTYKQSLEEEQNRLTERHCKLNKLKQELHEREIAILNETKQRLMEQNVEERSSFLDRTIDQMDRTRYFNEMHDKSIEQQTIQRNQELFKQREYLKHLLSIKFDEYQTLWPEHTAIQQQQEQISKSFDEILDTTKEDRYLHQLKLADRITILDNTLQQVELSLAKEMASRQNLLISNHSKVKNSELELITNKLENDVASLLEKLAEHRIHETQTRLKEISLSAKDREQRNLDNITFINKDLSSIQSTDYSTESTSSDTNTNSYPDKVH